MHISHRGLALIKHFEGFSSTPYLCPAGWWTIGYGHVLRAGVNNSLMHIEPEAAERLLLQDVALSVRAVGRLIEVPLSQPQRDALISFTYNVGAAALQRSSLRQVINRGEAEKIPRQWMRWVWAGGRKLPGLARRRSVELVLFQEGTR